MYCVFPQLSCSLPIDAIPTSRAVTFCCKIMMMRPLFFLKAFFLLALSTKWCGTAADTRGSHGLLRNVQGRNRNVPPDVGMERGLFSGRGDADHEEHGNLEASEDHHPVDEARDEDFWEGRLLMFQSMATSASPTVAPGTSPSTSITPTLSSFPSSASPHPTPANDNCNDAILVEIGDTISGTTDGSTSDSFPFCSMMENQSAGVWYKFQGNGSPVLVSTCVHAGLSSSYRYVSVYQGLACGQLECLPTYHQDLICGGVAFGSSIAMESNPNVTYYVHISAQDEWAFGEFSLSVSPYMKPIHDQCSKAGDITVDGAPVRGIVSRLVSEGDLPSIPCGSTMDFGSDMAWYEFTPTKNATLRASTCSSGTAAMSTGLTVVRGDCDVQTCLAESFPGTEYLNCGDGGSVVDFDAVADGSNYSVIVWGSIEGDLGFFELDIRSLNFPDNDNCKAAIELTVDGPKVTGTLLDSTVSIDELDPSCLRFDTTGVGVWYSFIGTGDYVSATVCSEVRFADISIYEGECDGSLQCLAPPSSITPMGCNANGGKSSTAQTIEGVTYYVLVSDFDSGILSESGVFDVSIKTVTPPTNNECSAAIEVIPDEDTRVIGNTMDAIYDEAFFSCTHGVSRSPALWYLVRGTGKAMRADTCSNYTNFDTDISIFEGPCGVNNSVCIFSNGNSCGSVSSSITWPTEAGVDYYIRVAGSWDNEAGEFGLRVSPYDVAANDDCSGAVALTMGVTVRASMEGSTPGDATDCFFDDSSTPGLWYYVDGLGSPLAISTCDAAGDGAFSGSIQLFQGSNCTSGLVCTSFKYGNDCVAPFSTASVKFFAEEGNRYYILFLGNWEDGLDFNKNFTVIVTDFEPPENDVCEGAFRVESSGLSIIGSNEDSLPDVMQCNGIFLSDSTLPGVWYTVQGTGRPMMATTCSNELATVTSLNVYSGSCDQLSCVAFGTLELNRPCEEVSRVIFQTEADLTYYILVGAVPSQSGDDFSLTISDVESPSNDLCSNATLIMPDTGTIVGSTLNASSLVSIDSIFSGESFCFFNAYSPGVWYSLIGTGKGYVLSTCSNETTFEAAISVMSGSCGQFECITSGGSNDFSCSSGIPSSRVELLTEIGVEYLIFVHGALAYARGNFGLTVSSYESAPNDP